MPLMACRDLDDENPLSTGATNTELRGTALHDGRFAWATREAARYLGATYVPEIDGDLDEDLEVHMARRGTSTRW